MGNHETRFIPRSTTFKSMKTIPQILKLTKRQREIIVGTLLGDGHLETQTAGRTYRLRIMHAASQREYIEWLYHEFRNIAAGPLHEKYFMVNGKDYRSYWFDTKNSSSLRFYAHQFYPQGKKQVPKIIARLLTPLALAVWYMDDGSIKSHETRGRILNTQGFLKGDIEHLMEILHKKFGITARLREQKEGFQIFIPSESYDVLVKVIDPHLISSMQYKLLFNTMPKE